MSFLIRLLAIMPAVAALLASSIPLTAATSKPNIVFILTDDQGYGDLSAHGHPLLKTPNFDRLHAESVRFDNFYVSPSCSPTRAALMTGMHEFRNGVTHTRNPRHQLWKEAVTLPQLLQKSGYRTALIGKWHLGGGGYQPKDCGFDLYARTQGDLFSGIVLRNLQKTSETPGKFREDCYFDEAMEFIKDCGDQPFFCEIATVSPHAPCIAPEEDIAPFQGKVSDVEAAYLGMVMNLDRNIGRLLDFLEEKKLAENTIVVLMNDNGATHGLDIFNAGMRGCKTTSWQGGSRAFSFWRWPGHWTPHTVDNLTAHLDFLPTICQLTGTPVPEETRKQLEGFSLVPLLDAKGPELWHDDRMLFVHAGRWTSGMAAAHKYYKAAVLQGHMMLVRSRPCGDSACNYDEGGECRTLVNVEAGGASANYTRKNAQFHWGITPPDHWSLFDLAKDPTCLNDLTEKNPALAQQLAAAYDTWWEGVYPLMIERGGDAPIDEEHKKAARKSASPAKRAASEVDG
jgi:arylsulfatase A-like enzyme